MIRKPGFISVIALAGILSSAAFGVAAPWDQRMNTSQVAGSDGVSRFTLVMAQGWAMEAMRDSETELVWELTPTLQRMTWDAARRHCLNLDKGGRRGWRLPSIVELMSLVDTEQHSPALPSGLDFGLVSFSNDNSEFYFTATRSESYTYGGPRYFKYEVNNSQPWNVYSTASQWYHSDMFRKVRVWVVNFRNGLAFEQTVKEHRGVTAVADLAQGHAWCVRGGSSPSLY